MKIGFVKTFAVNALAGKACAFKTRTGESKTSSPTPLLDVVAIVPAAGIGKRMKSECPKQYLSIGNKTLLEHSVQALLSHPLISKVVIVISADDQYFENTSLAKDCRVVIAIGGDERADSVLAGLLATTSPWVMVHDAARPCVCHQDIDALIVAASSHADGAILATPVCDTIKRANMTGDIESTLCREALWRALTPQMFRRELLVEALQNAQQNAQTVTDEASAIELAGGFPKLVLGRADNIKVTHPEDLLLAAFFLSRRQAKANELNKAK